MSQEKQTRHFALALVSVARSAIETSAFATLGSRSPCCAGSRFLTVYACDGPADKAMIIWVNFY